MQTLGWIKCSAIYRDELTTCDLAPFDTCDSVYLNQWSMTKKGNEFDCGAMPISNSNLGWIIIKFE